MSPSRIAIDRRSRLAQSLGVTPYSDPATGAARCANCGAPASEVRCAQCGWALPPPTRGPRSVDLKIGDKGPIVASATISGIIGFYIAIGLQLGDYWFVPPMLCTIIGALASMVIARRFRSAAFTQRAREYMNSVPLRAIGEVQGGLVRIRGRVHPIRTVRSRTGVECVAWENRPSGADTLTVHAEGGVFEIDDGCGERAVIDATHLGVPIGTSAGDDRFIEPGAIVELVGLARWVTPTEGSTSLASQRTSARQLEIQGTAASPVIICQVSPPAGSRSTRTGVRVVADGPIAVNAARVDTRVSASEDHVADENRRQHAQSSRR